MQKIITIRASHGGLNDKLTEFINDGWKVISTTKGSEWGRILNTYKWTVVLEKDEKIQTNDIVNELSKAKGLLDSGAITKKEFEEIKIKLLNK